MVRSGIKVPLLYFAVYRGLPFAAIGGVVVGPLAYRLIKTIQMITNLN